ncbi:MAG: SPFH domain-containing protein [Candidatus Wallbacteria bacterium]
MSQFIEVLEFLDNSGQVIACRLPGDDSGEIKYGAQLIVQQNQRAIFVKDGKFLDSFGAGRHTLVTENIPFLTKLLSLPYNFKSPFRASVYFVTLADFTNLKWGTGEPLLFKDSTFELVRLRARGTYSIRIADPAVFLGKIVGTAGRYVISQLEDYLRNVIVSQFFDALGTNITTVLDLPRIYDELGMLVTAQAKDQFVKYGIELMDVKVLAVTLPDEVQKMIDERASMGAVGDLNKYTKFKVAQSIKDFAQNSGSGSGIGTAAMDMGMGVAMGQVFADALKNHGENIKNNVVPAGQPEQGNAQPKPENNPAPSGAACVKCGAVNIKGARFCNNCGEKLIPAGFCRACSTQNADGSKFCNNCGAKL